MLSDTSASARLVYLRRLREMTSSERINIAVNLWEAGHRTQMAGMRHMYPNADDEEILFRIAVVRFGPELARKAYRRG